MLKTFLNEVVYGLAAMQESTSGWEVFFDSEHTLAGQPEVRVDVPNAAQRLTTALQLLDPKVYKVSLVVRPVLRLCTELGFLQSSRLACAGCSTTLTGAMLFQTCCMQTIAWHSLYVMCAVQGATIHAAMNLLTQASYRLLPPSLHQLATTPVDGATLLQRLETLLPLQHWCPDITKAWCQLVSNICEGAGGPLHQAAKAAGLHPQLRTGLQPLLNWLPTQPTRVLGAGPEVGFQINKKWGTTKATALEDLRAIVKSAVEALQGGGLVQQQGPAGGAGNAARLLRPESGKGAEPRPLGLQGHTTLPQKPHHNNHYHQQQQGSTGRKQVVKRGTLNLNLDGPGGTSAHAPQPAGRQVPSAGQPGDMEVVYLVISSSSDDTDDEAEGSSRAKRGARPAAPNLSQDPSGVPGAGYRTSASRPSFG
jgi:hypothetical protein